MKMFVRFSRILDSNFNHFAWEENGYSQWYDPYYEAIPQHRYGVQQIARSYPYSAVTEYDVMVALLYWLKDTGYIEEDAMYVTDIPISLRSKYIKR